VQLAIVRIDRTLVFQFASNARAGALRVQRPQSIVLADAVAIARTGVLLVIASLAILVLLPAAIAAQAAAI
jgi:hypothetical protein